MYVGAPKKEPDRINPDLVIDRAPKRSPGRIIGVLRPTIASVDWASIGWASIEGGFHRLLKSAMFHLITNARLYAPEAVGLRTILTAGERIVYVGESVPDLDPCLPVERTDVFGARVIPGLIDAHAHITGGGGEAGLHTKAPAPHLSAYTHAGITTVAGLLGTDDLTRSTSSLITRVKALKNEGLSAFCYTGGYHLPLTTLTGSAKSDIVHIEEILGVGELAVSDHRSSQPTLEEILRIASEAHVAGLMTGKAGVVHFHVGDGPAGLKLLREAIAESEIPARVFYPTHVNRRKALFEEACALTRSGCTIDVTAFPVGEEEDAYSAEDALMRYLDGDFDPTRITVSSDGGGCLPVFDADGQIESMDFARPEAVSRALAALVDRGHPLEKILPAFTSNVAKILRLPCKGRLVQGMDADLVVLGEDHRPASVMARGKWHVMNNQTIQTGTFEQN